ncbi:peptidoglycan-binding protein (plasmid) [Micromonospora sp. NBC_01405]|uniref:peptidoglycan-binding domain-containing protein n=1 Tax=Micromonospora sp. NBC_01405 TaxID=2903589 RepID=UPI003243F0EE
MSAIETVLWPGLRGLAPKSKLGGILARKRGYHNSRDHLPADDYSVQFYIDREGPADQGSAIDWTFPDAQDGDFRTIAHFSRLLLDAGRRGDSRAYPMREFFGNVDSDREVEGWDYARDKAATSDSSHLWHIHISIHRKYINDPVAMRCILGILADDPDDVPPTAPVVDWRKDVIAKMQTLKKGAKGIGVKRLQALLNVMGGGLREDGEFGALTDHAVRNCQRRQGIAVDGVAGRATWSKLMGV